MMVNFYEEIIHKIKTKRLKFMALVLQNADRKEESFETSTQALPGLIDNACKDFSQPINPQYAQDQLSLITGIMFPNPVIGAKTDKDKIWEYLRLEGTKAFLWVAEAFEEEKALNKKLSGKKKKIHFFRTRNRLNYFYKVFKHIRHELTPQIESGDIHCRYPSWKEELKAGIERTASYELARIKTKRGQTHLASQQLNRLQAAKQPFLNTDMFEID